LDRQSLFIVATASLALMAPSLIWGTLASHSSLHNLTWAAQFSEQVLTGTFYPRWLPDSFDGLGAPTFYFYPPLAFWVDALMRVVTLDALPTSWRLSVTSTALLFASGVAMYLWLRPQTATRQPALIGALVYMAAPYHLTDHYLRGAIAEFAAYAALPLVMASLALIARRHRLAVGALTLSYAALVTAHLPTALLISLSAIPAYVLFLAYRLRDSDRFFLPRCALGFALALGLTAPYLLPALTLQWAVSMEWMWRHAFQIDHGFLLMPGRWVQPPYMFLVIAAAAVGWMLASLGLLWRRGPVLLWAAVSLGSVVLMSGLLPWVWQLPMVSKVGFPWRLLIVVEFAAITALALAPWPGRNRLRRLVLLLSAVPLMAALTVIAAGVVDRVGVAIRGGAPSPQDAREYLPAGFPQRPDAGYADLGLDPIAMQPLISCEPAPRLCRAEAGAFGELRMEIESDQPVTVTARRFSFPAWRLSAAFALAASEPHRLVTFVAPAGRHELRLDRQTLPAEQWGLIASGLSLVGLALTAFRRRFLI
jgi:hypothetical protein